MKQYTDKEIEVLLSELVDTQRVQLVCSKHHYVAGGNKPATPGCKECMQCFWMYVIAKTPPHKRQEKVERLIEIVRKLNLAVERGEFKRPLDRRFKVNYEKDGIKDELLN